MCVKQWNSQTSKSDQSIGLDETFQLYLPHPQQQNKDPILILSSTNNTTYSTYERI
jgi:hypothetical protein